MNASFWARCHHCGGAGDVSRPEPPAPGFLGCPHCGSVLSEIDVSPFAAFVESRVESKRQLQATGRLGTRIQSTRQSDQDIDRDGTGAEIAACLICCPHHIDDLLRSMVEGGNNRGRDFPADWLGLRKPIEIKHTRHRTATKGYLIVRPPRWTPGEFVASQIDDSIYVLLTGDYPLYRIEGFADRNRLLSHGLLNPVPVGGNQRSCWGIHWSRMRPIEQLLEFAYRDKGGLSQ